MKKSKGVSIHELLVDQVYGLVRATADAICEGDDDVFKVEAELLDVLAKNCAVKRDVAKALAEQPVTALKK